MRATGEAPWFGSKRPRGLFISCYDGLARSGCLMDRTGAERQRRYIAKLKAAAARPQAGVADAAEVARLKARIAELEAELTRERAKKAPPRNWQRRKE